MGRKPSVSRSCVFEQLIQNSTFSNDLFGNPCWYDTTLSSNSLVCVGSHYYQCWVDPDDKNTPNVTHKELRPWLHPWYFLTITFSCLSFPPHRPYPFKGDLSSDSATGILHNGFVVHWGHRPITFSTGPSRLRFTGKPCLEENKPQAHNERMERHTL